MKYIYLLWLLGISISAYSQNEKAYEYIVDAIPYLHANKYYETIDKLQWAQKEVDKKYSYKEQFLIWNNMGLIFFKMSDFKEAIRYYQKAYELAKDNNKDEDAMIIINNLALLHSKINDNVQAQTYLQEALAIAQKNKIDAKIAMYLVNLSALLLEQNQWQQSKKYLQEFQAIHPNEIDQRTLINAKILEANILMKTGEHRASLPQLKKILSQCTDETYIEERLKTIISIAQIYRHLGDFNSSNNFLELGLSQTENLEYKIEFYDILSKNFLDLHQYQDAFRTKDSILLFKEKVQTNLNLQNLETEKLKFELSKIHYQHKSEVALHKQSKKHYAIVGVLLCITFILIVFLINKKHQNTKQKKLLIEKNLQIKNLELLKTQQSKELLEKELQQYLNESEAIKKEIAAIEKQYIEANQYKDKLIFDKDIYQQTTKDLLNELLNEIVIMKNSTSDADLLKIIQKLKNHLSLDEAVQNRISHEFYPLSESLKQAHPSLTAQDLRLLNLIYLEIETKEIAKLLYISPEGVRKRKERLKHKMNIEKEVDLKTYMRQWI